MKLIRIKKGIDLKILEKYGFSAFGLEERPDYVKKIRDNWCNGMEIRVKSYCNQIEFQSGGIPHCYLDNTLYEMFKDGIIEEFDTRDKWFDKKEENGIISS